MYVFVCMKIKAASVSWTSLCSLSDVEAYIAGLKSHAEYSQ